MADEIKTILSADPTPALAALDRIRASVEGLETEYGKLNKAGAHIFDGASQSTGEFIGDVQQLTQVMDAGQKAMQDLVKYEKFLEAQQKRTTDPVLIRKYADEIGRTKLAMAELQKAGVGAWQEIGKQQTIGSKIFEGLRGGIARALPVLSLSAVAVGAIKAASAYEQTRTSLETFLKSGEKADKLLGQLTEFATKTPFQSADVNAAAKSLLAFGESEDTVVEKLRQIGDISAATGKDLGELSVIYGKARVQGTLFAEDISQLTEAGIPIIQEFAKQLGVSESQVKKLASEGKIGFSQLETAFRNLTSEGGRFAGLTEAQSKTLAGQLSTLADGATNVLRRFVEWVGIPDGIKRVTENVTRLFDAISGKLAPAQKSAVDQVRQLQSEFNLEITVLKKANFSQEERAKAIQEINNKYGDYLPNLLSEKASLNDIEAAQRAVNDLLEQKIIFIAYEEEYKKVIEKGVQATKAAFAAEKERVKIGEQIAANNTDNGRFADFQKQQEALQASLRDESLKTAEQAPEDAKKIEESFNALAEKLGTSLAAIKKKFQETRKETGGGVNPEDAKKAAEAEKAREALRLAVLQDGRAKELAAEDLRNKEQLASLNKYFKGRDELNGLIEQADAQHRANRAEINKKYDAEEINALAEAEAAKQQLRLSLIEDGAQAEIAAENARFEKIKADLQKRFEGSAELPGLLERAQEQHLAKLNDINAAGLQAIFETEKQAGEDQIDLNEQNFKKIILLAQQRGASEEDIAIAQKRFDLIIQQQRLDNELKFQEALLSATGDGDEQRKKQIEATISTIKAELSNLGTELDGLTKSDKGFKLDFGELLGLDDKQVGAIKAAANEIIANVQAISAAKIQAAEEELQIATDKVKAAEDALAKEQDLAAEGFANNVALRQQDLANAKAAQETALKEKKKAQKAALIIDTITQASSLITSAANIFNSLSALPFGAGVPIAIALIAAMFGSFIAAKAKAFSAVNNSTFRQGGDAYVTGDGIVAGPSHEGGGVGIEVEGGEFMTSDGKRINIVRKHMTDKHFDLLTAINRDDTPKIAELAAQIGGFEGITFRQDTGATIERKHTERVIIKQSLELEHLKESNRLLAENNRLLATMAAEKEETTYFPGGRMVKRGNTTRIIRDRK